LQKRGYMDLFTVYAVPLTSPVNNTQPDWEMLY
jgi:hypothetical protein